MKLEEKIKQILEDKLHVRIRHYGETLFEMGADSLDLLEIACELEAECGIVLDEKDIAVDMTVRELVDLCNEIQRNTTKYNEIQLTTTSNNE